MLKPEIESQIKEFAKVNKISQAKLVEFVVGIMPTSKAGKPAKVETLALREKMINVIPTMGKFTTADLCSKLKADKVSVTNTLNYLAKSSGCVKIVGKVEGYTKRGRKPTIWSSVNN